MTAPPYSLYLHPAAAASAPCTGSLCPPPPPSRLRLLTALLCSLRSRNAKKRYFTYVPSIRPAISETHFLLSFLSQIVIGQGQKSSGPHRKTNNHSLLHKHQRSFQSSQFASRACFMRGRQRTLERTSHKKCQTNDLLAVGRVASEPACFQSMFDNILSNYGLV